MQSACIEAWPLVRMWMLAQRTKLLPKDADLAFCYDVLNKVSRRWPLCLRSELMPVKFLQIWLWRPLCSFSIVIQQLPRQLQDSICVFYLVLRALDTVEDDMSIPVEQKVPVLRRFHQHISERYHHLLSWPNIGTAALKALEAVRCSQQNCNDYEGRLSSCCIVNHTNKHCYTRSTHTQGMDNAMWGEGVCKAHGKISCCRQGLPPAATAAPKGQLKHSVHPFNGQRNWKALN